MIVIYLCTSNGKIQGNMTLSEDRLVFTPILEDPKKYRSTIDFRDIVDCYQVKLFNESGRYVHTTSRKGYMYDFYLQVDLRSSHSTDQPDVSVFFRFSHRDCQGRLLSIDKQHSVVSTVLKLIKARRLKSLTETHVSQMASCTEVPFSDSYDTVEQLKKVGFDQH